MKYTSIAWLCACMSLCMLPAQAQEIHSNVVDARTEVICKSMTQAVERYTRTVTILNRKGLEAAQFVCGCDRFNSLQKFSGELLNAGGQSVRKIKKSDLQKSEYNGASLATDEYFYFYECNYPSFPFTVKYEWEVRCDNGLIGYPNFIPQSRFDQAVEKASYRIELPANRLCRYKAVNTEGKDIQVKTSIGKEGQQVIEAIAAQLLPIANEPFSPGSARLFPRIYFVPAAFSFDKTQGDMSTWKTYGEWQYKLLNGRDRLTEPLKSKLRELTAQYKTDREKVKAVYDYLAKTTRYVSIQLGIGGLQPIAASEVCRTGFGDCKGLSNYTLAMLKELGIASTYTVISTTNERLLPHFSSANQMNHVILQVPLPNDTLWLECTNPQLPFGYVHQGIAGHDALLVEPAGGRVHCLPTYSDSLNTQRINATVTLSPTAEAKIEVNEVSRLFQYEDAASILYLEPVKQKDRIRSGINLSQADILCLQIDEHKEAQPSITLNYTAASNQYGHKTGSRFFIPANVFRKSFTVPRLTKRTTPIYVGYGYSDTDSICIKLPEGVEVEGLPQPMQVSSKFGTFSSSVEVRDGEIRIVHRLLMHRGTYHPEDYPDFIGFRKAVADQYNGKIVLVTSRQTRK